LITQAFLFKKKIKVKMRKVLDGRMQI